MDKKLQARLIKVNERARKRRAEGKKFCNGCLKPVKLIDFHVSNASRDGRVTLCKVCRSDKGKAERLSQPERPRKPVRTYNDKPIKCVQCRWHGITADLNNDLCPDCQEQTRPIYFGTIQDSLKALKDIGNEMSPTKTTRPLITDYRQSMKALKEITQEMMPQRI